MANNPRQRVHGLTVAANFTAGVLARNWQNSSGFIARRAKKNNRSGILEFVKKQA